MSEFQRKNNCTEKTAKSVDEAKALALQELGITEAEAEIEIISEGSKGIFGFGAKDAVVRVTVKNSAPEAPVSSPAVQSAPVSKQAENTGLSPQESASKFLNDIFKAMQLDVDIDAKAGEDNTISIDLSGDNMGIVIGKRGDTLDSLQYLTSLVVNQNSEDYIKVSIDTENYREKRTNALLALSKRLADKVARTGKKFTLEPMNPYERRVIHSSLQDNEAVTTYSIGSEPYRKVVIAPKNSKSGYKKHNNGAYKKKRSVDHAEKQEAPVAKKNSSYTTTYKADFKPQQHKAEYKSVDEYFADHSSEE